MIRVLLCIICLAAFTERAQAQCTANDAPYYHRTNANSPGSRLADFFLFPLTFVGGLVVASATGAVRPLCTPAHLAHHFVTGRAPKSSGD